MKAAIAATTLFAIPALGLVVMPAANAEDTTAPGQSVINLGNCRSVVAKTQAAGYNRYWAPGQIGVYSLVRNANGDWILTGPADTDGNWACGK